MLLTGKMLGGEINLGGDVPQHLLAILVGAVPPAGLIFSSTETTSVEEEEVEEVEEVCE